MAIKTKNLGVIGLILFFLSVSYSYAFTDEGADVLMKYKVEEELKYAKTNLRQVQTDITDTEYHLSKIIETKADLEFQLKNLDSAIADTESRLSSVISSSVQNENELQLLSEKIEISEIAFEYQKQLVKDYIELYYKEYVNLFPPSSDEDYVLRLLLSEKSVGDNLKNLEYVSLLNETAYHILDRLDEISFDLETQKLEYQDKNLVLKDLLASVAKEKKNLEEQKTAKKSFLASTQGQEEIYSQLLEQSKIEQNDAIETVKVFNIALKEINRDIETTGSFDPAKYEDLLGLNFLSISDFRKNYILNGSQVAFDWPVDPFKGLSAYFRDPGYSGVFGVRHNAIDIPAYQGSLVRSAADGVVFKVKDNGYGYNYIIVAHADGFSTVYGHISKILVSPGEVVSMGSILGLSGGMPGTKGAGYMTTGPHLHFEMLKDGEYVDPLFYVPLYVLTDAQMEWLPDNYKELWRLSVLEKAGGKIIRNSVEFSE